MFSNDLCWLRAEGSTLQPIRSRKLALPCRVAALVSRPGSEEIVVVLEDGSAATRPLDLRTHDGDTAHGELAADLDCDELEAAVRPFTAI